MVIEVKDLDRKAIQDCKTQFERKGMGLVALA